ncbi:hypothetical protein LCGC14_2096900 [marine sediment metagenome]|uniref:Uncharacterized protein n=1 Tax=marine sediment metagenome TaxID=412755 RepID=A0A0F9GPA5_9ZZZZ
MTNNEHAEQLNHVSTREDHPRMGSWLPCPSHPTVFASYLEVPVNVDRQEIVGFSDGELATFLSKRVKLALAHYLLDLKV